ncbi:class I SAM-dependent methyltransferase [Deinococcus budaensis]|uniref:Ubiquinone/menaquinone biosynthesis C-methylase UbiE n=1 Tax=Deinococcus budaensis TaxID=1665626 RepID=A0A7W8GIH2_9DEIO|nr:class I SAM-dependent methyltransferase [Deinococcus budaensis]MBB5236098.1 ubiquinone/menaquinone biosynthesis C-methylase UbiE [Deinococcus budaensis]
MDEAALNGIGAYYGQDREHLRLSRGSNQLEFERTQELVSRWLPSPPATVLDVGGGTGPYARWLLSRGYAVHLLDVVPLHIERVRADPSLDALASANVGDARALPYPDASADAALLLGPLYHLTRREDRLLALREVRRCLKPGGVLLAACITRTASTLDGLLAGLDADERFRQMRDQTLESGLHDPPDAAQGWFTRAYFHRPEELRQELEEAGFSGVRLYAIEGLGNLVPDFEARWNDPEQRGRLLDAVRRTEEDPSLFGISAHLLAVGSNPA